MQMSRVWQRCSLNQILKTELYTPVARAVLEEYLCSDNQHYYSIQELAKTHKMSGQQIENMIERSLNHLLAVDKNESILDSILKNVEDIIAQYKGPIAIDTWTSEALVKYGWDEVTALRYLRFAELIQNKIKIDTDTMLFWECNDKCRLCIPMRAKVEENHITDIAEIRSICEQSNCPVKPDRKIDLGMVLFHDQSKSKAPISKTSPFSSPSNYMGQEEVSIKTSVKPVLAPATALSSKTDTISQKLKLSQHSTKILEYLLSREEGVFEARLVAHGKIIKVDAMKAITEINDLYYTKYRAQLIESDQETGIWKVNIGRWTELAMELIYHKQSNDSDVLSDDAAPESTESIESKQCFDNETAQSENEVYISSETLIGVFKEALSNTRTSYKFYWAKSLLFCAKNRRVEVSLKSMAAMMCVYAYDDIEKSEYYYHPEDYIPILIHKVRKNIIFNGNHFDQSVQDVTSYLDRNDVNRLTASVKDYFFPVLYREKLVGVEAEKREALRETQEQNRDRFESYIVRGDSIYMKEDFCRIVDRSYDELIIVIDKLKQIKLSKKRRCGLMR